MGLLDWFRPAWKHRQPEVRRDAVAALSADDSADAAVLAEVLRKDPDASVRRVALKKVTDVALLDEVARSDADPELRAAAAQRGDERRMSAALAATTAGDARRALDALTRPESLVAVVTKAASPEARKAALERLTDNLSLVEIVRHAGDSELREAALDKITEARLLKDVAIHDAPRALQLRAVERLAEQTSIDSLEAVAQKAQVKAVRSAAAERLRALRPEPPKKESAKAALSREEERQAKLLAEAEERQRQEIERARQERAQKAAEEAAKRQAQVDEHARQRAQATQAQTAELDARREEERQRREAERVRREEEKARREAERAHREAERAEAERRYVAALEPLVARLEPLVESEDRKALEEVLKAARDVAPLRGKGSEETEAARARFEELRTKVNARLSELRDAESWRRWANVPKFEALIARVEALVPAEPVAALPAASAEAASPAVEPAAPEEAAPPVAEGAAEGPPAAEGQSTETAPPVPAEAAAAAPPALDVRKIAADLKALHAEWKALGSPPRERADALWKRFKDASDRVHERTQAGFAVLDEERAQNLVKKKELCAQAEAIADSTEWKETAEAIKKLQEEWKATGPVPKDEADAIWHRFRAACDRFFERYKVVLAERDADRAANLVKLTALVEKAEGLKESTDWKGTADNLKALQAEWKEVGPAGKTRAEADEVWQRFRAACDHFFERRKAVFAVEDEKRVANQKKKEELLARAEALADGGEVADPDATIRGLMQEWKIIGQVPREVADDLWSRFRTACDKIRTPDPVSTEAAEAEAARFSNRPLETLANKIGS